MRLGRIASIVIVATGVAAPAPGPAVSADARPMVAQTVVRDHAGRNGETGGLRLRRIASNDQPPADPASAPAEPRVAAFADAAPGIMPASFTVPQPAALPPASTPPRQYVVVHAAEPKAIEKPRAAAASDKSAVQLGAFTSEAGALAAWAKIAAASEGALAGLTPVAAPVDVPAKGRLWRLKATVSDKAAAGRLCQTLAQRKLACVPAKG